MKVFISWSGNRSRAVGEILNDWIKCVLQATRPWMSTRDIDRGALWFNEINDQLKDTAVGLVCLTQENKDRPWILFEAGALAKGLSSSRVCTFLIDLQPADLEDPLAQFNHTLPAKASMWSLVRTLNSCLGVSGLDERVLEQVFATYWPQFEKRIELSLKENPPGEKPEPRSEKNLLGEILENTRALHHRLRRIEATSERDIRAMSELANIDARNGPPSPRMARELVRDMIRSDFPTPLIIERLSGMGVPEPFVVECLEEVMSAKHAPKDKSPKTA